MKTLGIRLLLLLLVVSFPLNWLEGQQKISPKERKRELISPVVPGSLPREVDISSHESLPKQILREIEAIIQKGDGESFARYLGPEVFLSLKSSEGRYFTANQALYVLRNFFTTHKPITFAFSTYGEIEGSPYATGRGYFSTRGVRESFQVYVSLVMRGGRWVISEFNAY